MPRSRKHYLEFANFVCKFGPNLDLLDLAETIVVPAFLSGASRKYGKNRYILLNPAIVNLDETTYGIAFEFVKDTKFERDQVLGKDGRLHKDENSMESAPSALGLLVLNNHRLVYCPKTAYAPSLRELQLTCEVLLQQQRDIYLSKLLKEVDPEKLASMRLKLHREIPVPEVNILPLASTVTIDEAINQFELVNHVRAVAAQGHARIQINGKGGDGNSMTRDNDAVRIREPAAFEPTSAKTNAGDMYEALTDLIDKGLMKAPQMAKNATQKVLDVISKFTK